MMLNAFKFLTGPETVLALLDERERNQQYIKRRDRRTIYSLKVGKLRVELEWAENNLIDSECHVAELEEALAMSIRYLRSISREARTQNYKCEMHTSATGSKELDL